ncbi:Rok-like winged helix domain-containing protein [Bacillus sp. 0102A]|uniref:Rok-like winged helix domain-containing protein n=1 Tax=Bacillus sp. 0102A TaxID=3120563 RepID=UPI002FD94FC9
MADQREALCLRLAEIDKHEMSILREFQLEREKIFSSLRALEQSNIEKKRPSQVALIEQTVNDLKTYHITSKPIQRKKRRQGRAESKASREAALNILKQQDKPISSMELKRKIEMETGAHISNMTSFMNTLMKMHPEVKKPYRGQYRMI